MNTIERRLRRLESMRGPARRIMLYGPAGLAEDEIASFLASQGMERREDDELTVIVHPFGRDAAPSLVAANW